MTGHGGALAVARLDLDGRLMTADRRLVELNEAAGGAEGAPLALTAIASLARLARRLGIVVARPAMIADGDEEVELWVRADPQPDGTHVEVSGWREEGPPDESDYASAEAHFVWETDATMMLTNFSLAPQEGASSTGQLLTRAFDFGDEHGLARILTAAANRADFAEQPALLRSNKRHVRLSGRARVNPDGHFAGFAGTGRFEAEGPMVRPETPADGQFAERLDRALRLPLQRIVAHADSIGAQSDGPVRTEYVEYAHDIATAARHLMALVDDLVDLSAIERPEFRVEIETIDLADVARRAAGLLGVRAANAEVTIDRSGVTGELPARGEFRRALQILVNLIGNGVRYSPRGEPLTLTMAQDDDKVSVTVTDRGRGVAEADQARIFEKFGRVDPSEPGGSGLGLYIARRLAHAMGGDVTVQSEAGQGAAFTLTLPAA